MTKRPPSQLRSHWPDSASRPVVSPLQPSVVYASDDPDALSLAIPLNVAIEAGDNLLIAVAGRTEQAITPDRRARIDARIDDLEPGRGNFAQAMLSHARLLRDLGKYDNLSYS